MIHSVTGRPSGGKSLFAWYKILSILRDPEETRFIVTNVPFDMDDAVRLLVLEEGRNVDPYSRVRQLARSEWLDFWRYRGGPNAVELMSTAPRQEDAVAFSECVRAHDQLDLSKRGLVLPSPPDVKKYNAVWLNTVLEPCAFLPGVIFVIDEMHEVLNARNWQRHGMVVPDYAGIHAHVNDEVWWVTQAPKLVDSSFKVRTQDWYVVQNKREQRIFGHFRMEGFTQFEWNSFLSEDHKGQVPQASGKFSLRPREARIYKRSRFGGDGDTKKKKTGLNFWWLVFAGLFAVLLLSVLGAYGPQAVVRWALHRKDKPPSPPSSSSPSPAPSPALPSPNSRVLSTPLGSPPAYSLIRETRLGFLEPGTLRTREEGTYRVGTMSSRGFVQAIQGDVVLIRPPFGGRLYVVACEPEKGSSAAIPSSFASAPVPALSSSSSFSADRSRPLYNADANRPPPFGGWADPERDQPYGGTNLPSVQGVRNLQKNALDEKKVSSSL